ncbi:hypothetical protein K505DRAFT_377078 [Melanomma pulvis-pyrius CBS 109.77]|uniref:Uncharacterized protein n=1 Tax=Melanomma pulvis-pyrius CBS 109.77 TaxID=1314802 RepID=A0A6A6X3V8_9PLEO|nr:hypothetical protein K505DRAFT_377078 [Melanomma pulvis-pyrius CBS 109.77]
MISSSSHHRRHRRFVAPEVRFDTSYTEDMRYLKDYDSEALHSPSFRHHEALYNSRFHDYKYDSEPRFPPFLTPRGDASHLQSRANALSRRCANLSTSLGHLEAVVDVLCAKNYRDLTDAQIQDVRAEGDLVWKAVAEFERGMIEVGAMLDEIEAQRMELRLVSLRGEKARRERRGGGGW